MNVVSPTPRPVTPSPPAPPPPGPQQTVVSDWEGTSQVTSAEKLPACIPSVWKVGASDTMSWEFLKADHYKPEQYDLHLIQRYSAELCHLSASINGKHLTAGSWDDLGLGLEGEAWCHFQLHSESWGCTGLPPEVWILGIDVAGEFGDTAQTRAQGMLEIRYDYRTGPGPYTTATIRKTFEVVKVK